MSAGSLDGRIEMGGYDVSGVAGFGGAAFKFLGLHMVALYELCAVACCR
jgi:hypothetical protein